MTSKFVAILLVGVAMVASVRLEAGEIKSTPVKLIFDTDMGNDIDDVMALALLHSLETRGECQILAITVTKRDELAGPFVDAINTFYGRPNIPIGCVPPNPDEQTSKYLPLINVEDDGNIRYPHRLKAGSKSLPPMDLLRKTLSEQADGSVVLIQIGYFSNFAALLDTMPDKFSPLNGKALVKQKVKFLSVMAGCFKSLGGNDHIKEFNVVQDLPAAQKLVREWPAPIIWSGLEVGNEIRYPASSIEKDFSYLPHHIVSEAYYLYNPPPHERPTWDLTSSLYAVFPGRGDFDLSEPGRVTLDPDGASHFTPKHGGRDRHLILKPDRVARIKEEFVQLVSQPPMSVKK